MNWRRREHAYTSVLAIAAVGVLSLGLVMAAEAGSSSPGRNFKVISGGFMDPQNIEWLFSISGRRIRADRMPSEYFVVLQDKEHLVPLNESERKAEGGPTLLEVPASLVYRPDFLPESSPYRIVRNASPSAQNALDTDGRKLPGETTVVLLPTPEVCDRIVPSEIARATRLFPGWVDAQADKPGFPILSPGGTLLGYVYGVKKGEEVLGYISVNADPALFPTIEYSRGDRPQERLRFFEGSAGKILGGPPQESDILYLGTGKYAGRYRLAERSVALNLATGSIISATELASATERLSTVRERNRLYSYQQWAAFLTLEPSSQNKTENPAPPEQEVNQ